MISRSALLQEAECCHYTEGQQIPLAIEPAKNRLKLSETENQKRDWDKEC